MPPASDAPEIVPQGKTSDAVLDRLTRLHPKVIDLSLGRVERLLDRLGHPERRLAPVVHVAGTNGKGSLLAFLRAMLEAADRRVQVYTSPHLVRFHERIRLSRGLIDEAALIALLERCEAENGPEPITFFEVTTAAAFLAFAEDPADILLLETGLGGRLDATNVIDRPRLTAITPVALDHQQFLGPSLEVIAREKAGIMKPGVTCVTGPQEPAALAVLEQHARETGAPLFAYGRDWTFTATPGGFRYEDAKGLRKLPKPGLLGSHQIANAALAVACAAQLGEFDLSDNAIEAGIARATWPARLQRLTKGPVVEALPAGWELWLDGGHNPAAGQALAETIRAEWGEGAAGRPLDLVYGMLDTKVAAGYLEALAPLTQSLQAVRIPGEAASLSAEAAADHAQKAGIDAAPADSVLAAVQRLVEEGIDSGSGKPHRILICGSLYLAGHVLAENG
ncbi:bifunctional folylpolyglutamate synthase/dihydrofolate synthase [Pelagibius marinus]|uniref:bifunctional folylpolyglutamate synthase/dihydrofolate synthase n=1 Tax=Pelagibius marinus TaxID=2762760 RepID=UPI001872E757|nr:folylpolyglutamate synthase/dihydrofolate synthase family protein [Pelagibius marinus]